MTTPKPTIRQSPQGRQAISSALFEYLIIVFPIACFVILEAQHKHDYMYILKSPEWAIGTAFLSFQGIFLYRRDLDKINARPAEGKFGLLTIGALFIIFISFVNVRESLEKNTVGLIIFRGILFVLVSIFFILLVAGGKFYQKTKKH